MRSHLLFFNNLFVPWQRCEKYKIYEIYHNMNKWHLKESKTRMVKLVKGPYWFKKSKVFNFPQIEENQNFLSLTLATPSSKKITNKTEKPIFKNYTFNPNFPGLPCLNFWKKRFPMLVQFCVKWSRYIFIFCFFHYIDVIYLTSHFLYPILKKIIMLTNSE